MVVFTKKGLNGDGVVVDCTLEIVRHLCVGIVIPIVELIHVDSGKSNIEHVRVLSTGIEDLFEIFRIEVRNHEHEVDRSRLCCYSNTVISSWSELAISFYQDLFIKVGFECIW